MGSEKSSAVGSSEKGAGVRFFITGEQPIFCDGVASALHQLEAPPEIDICHRLADAPGIVAGKGPFDLMLADVPAPADEAGLEFLGELLGVTGAGPLVVFCDEDHPRIVRAVMGRGVRGFVPKSFSRELLLNALRLVLAGARYVPESVLDARSEGFSDAPGLFLDGGLEKLTPRQLEVLKVLALGWSNQAIANALHIKVATVKLHVNAILSTLGVSNRTSAAFIANKAGLAARGLTDRPRG